MTERIVAAFVPLVDCAVLVAAREQGFAAEAGARSRARQGAVVGQPARSPVPRPRRLRACVGAAAGSVDARRRPRASRLHRAVRPRARRQRRHGFDAAVRRDVREGSRRELRRPRRQRAARSRPSSRARATPLTLGMVFPFSNHNFDLRYWLAAAGVHPDRDVRLVAIPPPLMVDSLRAGLVDGFCVGEPWNSLAALQGLGRIVATQSQLFPRAVEKVLALRASFAERRSRCREAVASARRRRQAWADDASNHSALAALLARPDYLGVPQEIIAAALDGRLRLGAGAAKRDRRFHVLPPARGERAACSRWALGLRADGSLGTARAERAGANALPPKCFVPISIDRACPAASVAAPPAPPPFDRIEFVAKNVPAPISAVRRAYAVRGRSLALTHAAALLCSVAGASMNHRGAAGAQDAARRFARSD